MCSVSLVYCTCTSAVLNGDRKRNSAACSWAFISAIGHYWHLTFVNVPFILALPFGKRNACWLFAVRLLQQYTSTIVNETGCSSQESSAEVVCMRHRDPLYKHENRPAFYWYFFMWGVCGPQKWVIKCLYVFFFFMDPQIVFFAAYAVADHL